MKKVVKVSIGGIAFTLDEDAYRVINQYLSELNEYYSDRENGKEIIEGIEERLAELLLERRKEEGVISEEVVLEVTDVIGKPYDGEDVEGKREKREKGQATKRLYRDPGNKVFGGVLGGVAAYFNIDSSIIRVIAVVLFFLATFSTYFTGGLFALAIYCIFWIIIPKAKTVEQRYAMRGETPSIDNIQKNVEKEIRDLSSRIEEVANETRPFWRRLWMVITKCIGMMLTLMGIVGVVVAMLLFSGVQIFDTTFNDWMLLLFDTSRVNSIIVKISLLLSGLLPFVGMLYGGIQMLFGFKSPKWRPGLILFIIWVISIIFSISFITISAMPYRSTQSFSNSLEIEVSDTLYVSFTEVERWRGKPSYIEANKESYNLFFVDNENSGGLEVAIYPKIRISRKEEQGHLSLTRRTELFTHRMDIEEMSEAKEMNYCRVNGNVIELDPILLRDNRDLVELDRRVTLNVEPGTVVVIESPVYHEFKNRFEYNNLKGLLKWGFN